MRNSKIFVLGVIVWLSLTGSSFSGEMIKNQTAVQENLKLEANVSQEIQNLIQQLKEAPVQERYKYMNQLKIKLKELNQQERIKIINQLREQLRQGNIEKSQYNDSQNTQNTPKSFQYKESNMFNRNIETQNRFMGNKNSQTGLNSGFNIDRSQNTHRRGR
ncbi:MAG: hypothetical protein GXO22_03705 [Aquificae bacterium]|nr:hypothetical protein [Aquificota bacterium]